MVHIRKVPSWQVPERHATPEETFVNRRQVVKSLGLGLLGAALPSLGRAEEVPAGMLDPALGQRFADRFPAQRNSAFSPTDPITAEKVAGLYNNFYEFTTNKEKVWQLARDYPVDPWSVDVAGLVEKPMTLGLEDLLARFPLEERLYRLRCVERWSMLVPWTGYPLRLLIDHVKPLSTARWIQFTSFHDPRGLPGQQKQRWYPWPYFETLRLDEARNDLAFVVVGSYGHGLPMQHGAPWRLAIPWKYGYKSPKSIVKIEFLAEQPTTFWNEQEPTEYGIYSNVEPHKPHPRWSQQWEQDIGTGETRDTQLYNGYQEQVAKLYDGSEH